MVGQVKLLDVAGPLQVFSDARQADGTRAYDVVIASENGGPMPTDAGMVLESTQLEDALNSPLDTLLVTGGDTFSVPVPGKVLRQQLGKHAGRPRRLGSICVGAFVLAQLGLLDGHKLTTHWEASSRLEREYKSITVDADAIFVKSGRIWTSAGVSAGIDMALAMVEEDIGHAAALSLARKLVLFLKRTGGQSQFSVELRRQMRDAHGRFDQLHAWMQENLDGDLSVPALAKAANMSDRNFARVYRRETGASPAQAVEQLRIEAARRLLESSLEPIQRIAHHIGFRDDERMRRAFQRAYGVSPQDYRSKFGRVSA